ncbi:hypothetical protein GBAR_LOCUS4927 [Geodia barretti]|uniref:CxC2-like cysteine cluster KDZ transposase-associated domain-containing protein n=2 Tax=Geodia barretti TaxID=519541 RepID=A0AA35R9U8_GEOBA|nr:hypothetical protein GBAR_LOCUS4927 [Geodia barretti]
MFSCCDCEPTALTMVRARLWPASPRLPKLAFTFELLEWAEALLLECQVALGDFCKALHFKSPHLTNKERGSVMISMDALFGLPRKKSAGQSHRDPLHGHIFFKDQPSVDENVASSSRRNAYDKVCSDFLAGDVLRSSNRYKALDETALFGCACRHEFPLMFINLKHGEKGN